MNSRQRPAGGTIVRRDADGIATFSPTWEALSERLIREAQDAGHFDDLPGQGRPLARTDDSLAGDMALAHHVLRNAGLAPPWIEADKEVRAIAADIEAALSAVATATSHDLPRLRSRIEDLLAWHAAAVARLASLAPTPRQHRRNLDRDAILARFREADSRQPDR